MRREMPHTTRIQIILLLGNDRKIKKTAVYLFFSQPAISEIMGFLKIIFSFFPSFFPAKYRIKIFTTIMMKAVFVKIN